MGVIRGKLMAAIAQVSPKEGRTWGTRQLKSMPVCLAKALIPLDEFEQFKKYSGNVNNKDFYPTDSVPPEEIRERRAEQLGDYHERFLRFQVPVAELPDSVSLAEVCEIFDVLNTTGTKVSTFDLIHNLNFANTKGAFDLRGRFESCQEEYSYLSLLCDPGRPEFFCQMVTGCYLSEPEPRTRKASDAVAKSTSIAVSVGGDKRPGDELVKTVKGGDLLETPTAFYEVFSKNLPKVDSYSSTLFSPEVLGTEAYLKELPYPVSVIHYLSLRWAQEKTIPKDDQFTVSQLNRLYRAFFWSNSLSARYDQGFLTLFSTDLKTLRSILTETKDLPDSEWAEKCNELLDEQVFKTQNRRRTKEDLAAVVLEGELRGAARQAVALFMYAKVGVEPLRRQASR